MSFLHMALPSKMWTVGSCPTSMVNGLVCPYLGASMYVPYLLLDPLGKLLGPNRFIAKHYSGTSHRRQICASLHRDGDLAAPRHRPRTVHGAETMGSLKGVREKELRHLEEPEGGLWN